MFYFIIHSGNNATSQGGGIYITESNEHETPNHLIQNTPLGLDLISEYHFTNCAIENNTAGAGGGIYISLSPFNVSVPTFGAGTIITKNLARQFGGGLFMMADGNQTFMNNVEFLK